MKPLHRLTDKLEFPPPGSADSEGLLAFGGDLSVERLVLAYSMGIFPWYSEGLPILWWSTDPRLVLFPEELKVSRSLRQTIRKNTFEVRYDADFEGVINACASIDRAGQRDTWLTRQMIEAYIELHRAGHAHSVESYLDGRLMGGLYGVSIGRAFFGESMFARASNASKVAFVHLVKRLSAWGFRLIDCQQTTGHLMRFGARELPRAGFLNLLKEAVNSPSAWDNNS